MRAHSFLLCGFVVCVTAVPCRAADTNASPDDDKKGGRPVMRQLSPARASAAVPTAQAIAIARPDVQKRFRETLSHAASAAGARQAAETLLSAAGAEDDRTLRWIMIDEARRLGEAAGQAGIVTRAIAAASAAYEFDAVEAELRTLKLIPLRILDAARASGVAVAAEGVAARAAADGRADTSLSAELLAYRAWQRAGDIAAARRAAARHDALLAAREGDATASPP